MPLPKLSSFIKNTLEESLAGFILDARQGKILKDLVDAKAPLTNPRFTEKVYVPEPNGNDFAFQAARQGTLDDRVPPPDSASSNKYLRSNDDGCSHWDGDVAPLANPTGGQNNYAPKASPIFTGTVILPAIVSTNTATQEYVDNAAALDDGLPVGTIYRTGDLLKIVHA